jgi:hypothetical protein
MEQNGAEERGNRGGKGATLKSGMGLIYNILQKDGFTILELRTIT